MTRSRMERALRALIKQAGLPAPHSNVRVHGHEVDMYWPAHRVVVEFDGWDTHSSRTAFESDRLKDAALQLAGERVIRVTGRQLEGRPHALVARLAVAISTMRPTAGPVGKLTHGRKANPESFIPQARLPNTWMKDRGIFVFRPQVRTAETTER